MKSKLLIFFVYIFIFSLKNAVFSLGESEDFNKFFKMVEEFIDASKKYSIPKDNSDMLKLNDVSVPPLDESVDFDTFSTIFEELLTGSKNYSIPKDSDILQPDGMSVKDFGTYDFIIVGGGTAGLIMANRLSEISNWSILVLEAGGKDNDFTKILGLNTYTIHSKFNWGYNTTVQTNACLGFKNKRCACPQGKVIGGSSTINGGVYSRGEAEDYDRWANVYGNQGWSYKEVLPYFKKSENAVFYPRDEDYHGVGGYFTVNYTVETPGLDPLLIKAFNEQEWPVYDYNGRLQNGISKVQYALRGNERVSTASAFLYNVLDRSNLNVSLNSFVTKLLIDENNVAYGVQFVKDSQVYIAKARKEVIVSAGAINSPQLLMLSGIGPKEHLRKLCIPVKKDLPVGKNFQDHVLFLGLNFRTTQTFYTQNLEEQLKLYVKHERPLTAGFFAEMLGLVNFPQNQSRRSDIEYAFIVPGFSSDFAQFGFFLNDEYTAAYKTNPSTDISALLFLLHPKSRGTVTLKSSSPVDRPIINPNYLSEEEDIEKMYQGIKFLIALNNTQAFQEAGVKLVIFDYPNCESFEKLTKDWWICALRHLSSSSYHPASTNRMGPDPRTSVVDSNLNVYGFKKLRVVDSSIFPELTSGHLMAPVMMVSEKAADIIKAKYGQKSGRKNYKRRVRAFFQKMNT